VPESGGGTVAGMTENPTPSLNTALDELVQALEATPTLAGVREGLQGYELVLRLIDPEHPAAAEAADLARVWRALDYVAGAVLAAREEHSNG
jgi:hypothetical protein